MTLRASGFRHKYAVAGAGAVGKSLIGRLPGKARDIGLVVGVSYRVASRIANGLRAGVAAREPGELNGTPIVLLHSPPDQMPGLTQVLLSDQIDWAEKSVVICDSDVDAVSLECLVERGASIATVREFGLDGYLAIQGMGSALPAAHRFARDLRLKAIEIPPGAGASFDAAVTLASGAFTPLIDRAALLLRHSGVREADAPRLAAALFQQTAADFIHSGKQSWHWYMQGPEALQIEAQLSSAAALAGESLALALRQLVLLGFDIFDKHQEVAETLSAPRSGD
jgi:hypothetical protein